MPKDDAKIQIRNFRKGARASGEGFGSASEKVLKVSLDQIQPDPNNPRQTFDEDYIGELPDSIASAGQQFALKRLRDLTGMEWGEIAARIGQNEKTVIRKVRAFRMGDEIVDLVATRRLKTTHINVLGVIKDPVVTTTLGRVVAKMGIPVDKTGVIAQLVKDASAPATEEAAEEMVMASVEQVLARDRRADVPRNPAPEGFTREYIGEVKTLISSYLWSDERTLEKDAELMKMLEIMQKSLNPK